MTEARFCVRAIGAVYILYGLVLTFLPYSFLYTGVGAGVLIDPRLAGTGWGLVFMGTGLAGFLLEDWPVTLARERAAFLLVWGMTLTYLSASLADSLIFQNGIGRPLVWFLVLVALTTVGILAKRQMTLMLQLAELQETVKASTANAEAKAHQNMTAQQETTRADTVDVAAPPQTDTTGGSDE